ncbi:MAG: tetratricopeptide repeat protein [Armatimonadota bacterium]
MIYRDDVSHCPKCGASVRRSVTAEDDDPVAQITRTLLFQARTYQQRGDLANAIKCATDALAIQPTCSTIHTFLGSLYEQKGEMAAARRHFQKALTVMPEPSEPCDLPLPALPEAVIVRPVSSGWMLPVLVGCIVFSGLAAMFTLWPGNPVVRLGGVAPIFRQQPESRLPLPGSERDVKPAVEQPAATTGEKERPKSTRHPEATPIPVPNNNATNATASNLALVPRVIGPRATATLPVMPVTPTVEHADTAYQQKEYERAAAIYENVLPAQDKPNPRAYQHLAQCYQQLGNTKKVQDYLEKAIEEYKVAAADDPQNAAVRQELKNCQTMLESVRNGHPAP